MECAFVGLGHLGRRVAGRLVGAGFGLRVNDLNPDAAPELLSAGASWAASPARAVAGRDVLVTCLPSPAATEAVMFGLDGALAGMDAGSTWIECSTVSVEHAKRFAASAEACGVKFLECPMTGGLHRAERGEMTIFVGGDEATFSAHRALLEAMGGPVIHLGDIGSASLAKVLTNLLCLVDLVVAGEAMVLAKEGGLDLGKFYEAVCASSGTSREFEDWVPVILNGSLNTGFSLDLALKDLTFVRELADQSDAPFELTRLCESMFKQAKHRYGGDAWTPHVVQAMEEASGVELRAPGFAPTIDESLEAADRGKLTNPSNDQ